MVRAEAAALPPGGSRFPFAAEGCALPLEGIKVGGLYLTRVPSPTSGGAAGDWYTTANLLQFGALVCSESSVVYPLMEMAPIATWGNARGAAAAALKFVYNRKYAAARFGHLQRIFGCIPCRVGKAAFAWKGTAPLPCAIARIALTRESGAWRWDGMYQMCGLVRFSVKELGRGVCCIGRCRRASLGLWGARRRFCALRSRPRLGIASWRRLRG